MADDSSPDLMALFQEFLTEREAKNAQEAQAQDDEIEIWNADGSGARGRRSGFADWLRKNGFSVEPEPPEGAEGDKGKSSGSDPKSGRKSTGKTSNATGSASVARKYFGAKQP